MAGQVIPPDQRPLTRSDMVQLTMLATELHRNHVKALEKYTPTDCSNLAFALRRLINSAPEIK